MRRKKLLLEAGDCAQRHRAEPESCRECSARGDQRDNADGQQQSPEANAGSVQRHDLAVGGQSPEADEHADQHAHGKRKAEHRRKRAEKQQGHGPDAARVPDDKVHQAHELRNEEYESEDGEAQDGVGNYFASNISIEKAHRSAEHILASGEAD